MSNINGHEIESSHLRDERAKGGSNQPQVSRINDANLQAIVPVIEESLQNKLATGDLDSTFKAINVVNVNIGNI